MRRAFAAAAFAAALVAAAPAAAAVDPPDTLATPQTRVAAESTAAPLSGEDLWAGGAAGYPGYPVSVTGACNPEGVTSLTYSTSGVATGPYPGTFTETGTVTIGPETIHA